MIKNKKNYVNVVKHLTNILDFKKAACYKFVITRVFRKRYPRFLFCAQTVTKDIQSFKEAENEKQ